jgi:ABC-type proline/glycine betaine transport system permease subunit
MRENIWFNAAIWMGLVVTASIVSICIGISVGRVLGHTADGISEHAACNVLIRA